MPQVKITSKAGAGRGRHYHIAYMNLETGEALLSDASKGKSHSHEMQFIPPVQDPQTGEMIQEPSWIVLPAEDGHTHESFEDYEIDVKEKKEDESKVCAEVIGLYKEACEIEADSRRKAKEARDFVRGKQWDANTKAYLQNLKRPALTINKIEKAVDTLCGMQMQERTDFRYEPFEDGDQVTVDIYNIVADHIKNSNNYARVKSKVFRDIVIDGRGAFNLRVDFDNSLEGNPKIEYFPNCDIKLGPHNEDDASDCEYAFKEKMYSKAKMKQLWPKKADEIEADFEAFADPVEQHNRYRGAQYTMSDNWVDFHGMPTSINGQPMVDIAKKEFRVLECWRKVYDRKKLLVHESGLIVDGHGWKSKDVKLLTSLPGFYIFERTFTKIRISRIAGNVLLSDENPANVPGNDFNLCVAYAYKDGNDYWGKVESAKDPQREVNRRHSQLADIINKMANYNHFYTDATFVNKQEEEKFRQTASMPGASFKLTTFDQMPQKSEGVKFPGEIVALLDMASQEVESTLNVVVESAGANESGPKYLQRQKQAMSSNEFLFDNLAMAEKKLGKLLIHMIQRYYTPERIMRILSYSGSRQPITLDGQPLEQFSEEEIYAALENVDATTFDVVVVEAEDTPTRILENYMLLSEALAAGYDVPPEMLVENFPNASDSTKRRWLQYIQQQMQSQTEQISMQGDTEVKKTLIAQGIIPPEVAEQYGLNGGEALEISDIPGEATSEGAVAQTPPFPQ